MKPKTLVLMVVAVTCGLGASYMTSRLLADRHTEEAEKIPVLVAKRQINTGEAVKVPQDFFEEKLFVKGEEPKDSILKFDDVKGRIMKRALRPGDFIRVEDMLDSKDPQSTFSYNLPEGFRAVGLRVNMEAIAGGFAALPMSRVDIIQTVRRGDDKSSYAKILLQNVLVLAADARTTRDEGGNAMPANIVTLALSPEDVLKLNLSREIGVLSLALRKFNDNKRSPINEVNAADIKNDKIGVDVAEEKEAATESGMSGSGASSLPLPPLKADDAKPAVDLAKEPPPPPPTTRTHTLVILEGEKVRPINFTLDRDLRVVNQEVARSELAPAPVPTRPPQPTAQPKDPQPIPE